MRRVTLLVALAVAVGLVLPLVRGQERSGRLRVLVLTGESDLPYHDWRVSTPFLQQLLERSGRFEVKVIEQAHDISAKTLDTSDLLLLNYNGPRWGSQTEKAVEDFVRGGKGMISYHATSYGAFYGMEFDRATSRWKPGADGGWAAYAALIGARWDTAKIGHGARHQFTVKWVDSQHPISRGLEPMFMADDELYHRLDLLPGSHVLATAFDDPASGGTGKDEPIVWTFAFGKGRTVHITLGHDVKAMSQPGFALVFVRAAEWAATGQVTLPAR